MSAARKWVNASLIRCDAATAGPWSWDADLWLTASSELFSAHYVVSPTATEIANGDIATLDVSGPDGAFIAAARDDLPKALAALRAVMAFAEEEWGPSTQLPSVLQPFTVTARLERVIAEALGVQP